MGNEKGNRRERELRDEFRSAGFTVLRVAGSGSSPGDDLPDLFVGDGSGMYAIEVKASKRDSHIYIDPDEVRSLSQFSHGFHTDVVPVIAVKFDYLEWHVLEPIEAYQLYHTDTGRVRVRTDDLDTWTSLDTLLSDTDGGD